MADKTVTATKKTAAELDEEIDEFMKERSSGKKRVITFTEENWEEVWLLICMKTCRTNSHVFTQLGIVYRWFSTIESWKSRNKDNMQVWFFVISGRYTQKWTLSGSGNYSSRVRDQSSSGMNVRYTCSGQLLASRRLEWWGRHQQTY